MDGGHQCLRRKESAQNILDFGFNISSFSKKEQSYGFWPEFIS